MLFCLIFLIMSFSKKKKKFFVVADKQSVLFRVCHIHAWHCAVCTKEITLAEYSKYIEKKKRAKKARVTLL